MSRLFLKFIFNWRIITLQGCVHFCHTVKSTSHKHTCVPSVWDLRPLPHPILPLQHVTEYWAELPMLHSSVPIIFFSSCDSVVGDALEFNKANRGSLRA